MSWNIEIAVIRTDKPAAFDEFMSDVLDETDQRVDWESATSSIRDTDMCAGWVSGWGIVVDVLCRLSTADRYLEDVSRNTELFVFRVANEPDEVHYKQGSKMWKHTGVEALLSALGMKPPDERDYVDGETIAHEWISQRTGLDFDDDFRNISYVVYKLP